jgi:hypothetical protein
VGSRGDSYDNALSESVIGLFKTEVIRRQGPWRISITRVRDPGRDRVVHHAATARTPLGYLPPAELEAQHHAAVASQATQQAA